MKLNTSTEKENILYNLLKIENTEKILDFTVPDQSYPIWLYIRFNFFMNLIDFFNKKNNIPPEVQILNKRKLSYKNFFINLFNIFTPWPKRDIWYLSNIGECYYKKINDQLIDIYNDPFANIFPQNSLYISQSLQTTKNIIKDNYPYKFIQIPRIIFRLTRSLFISKKDVKAVNKFINFLKLQTKENVNFDIPIEYWDSLKEEALQKIGTSKVQTVFYDKLFNYRKPKILILTDAFYGYPDIISQAKKHNIITIEIQHGAYSYMHPAYNWASTLCQCNKIKNFVVDYFLTFGLFWHTRFQIPSKYIEIGSPWFSIQKDKFIQSGNAIFFVLSSYYNFFKNIISEIKNYFPERKIIVRPHPREHHLFNSSKIPEIEGIIIDTNSDIYETFSQANIVIGEVSTSIYEALALGKRVFVLNTYKSNIFYSNINITYFNNASELVKLIEDNNAGHQTSYTKSALFNTNWEKRYKSFIENLLRGEPKTNV